MAVKGGASPFRGGEYKGLFQKESEEFRMEHQRDKRPIYSLSSFPVLERRGETVKDKGGKHGAHLLKEERPSVSHALDRSPRRKGNDAKTKMSLEDELEINNPELFNSLREVKRTLRGHSMKRFQQFESLAMMNPLENSVRATAALRVDLIRRTGGLGVKAELEDDKLNKNDETSLEVQLEQALMFKDLEDLRAFKLKESSDKYETQYEKNRKMKRAMQSRTLEIQREAEAVSKALSRALEKYRGAIKETLQEPKVRRDVARSQGRRSIEGKEDVSEEVGTSLSPDSMSKEEKRQVLVHSANSNVDKAKGVLERLKLYTQTVYAFQHAGDAAAEAPKDEEDEASESKTGAEKEKEEAVSQPEKSAVTAKPDNKSRPSTSVQKSGRIRTKRSSIAKSSVKVDQEYEEELARAREVAKREEDERKYQQAILLLPWRGWTKWRNPTPFRRALRESGTFWICP